MTISRHTRAVLATVAFTALALGCGSHGADESDSTAPATVAARTAAVTVRPFAVTVNAIGAVAARPGHYAELSAPAPARIARIFVTPGQHVKQGDPLIAFERAPFDAEANGAEAALTAAQNAYDRAVRLVHDGILPQKDVDEAAATLAEAKANAVKARRAQERATLRSPLDGVVTSLSAVLSASVDANQPLVEVADPTALDIVLQLSPTQAAPVHSGDSATFTAGQDPAGERLGTGRITDVGMTVDSVSRTVAVRAHIAHPTRPLRIGETVFGQIAVAVHSHALTVPTEALVPDGQGFKVFVVDAHGIAHARPVTVGARSEGFAEITKGVHAGETVVTYGAYGVEDSSRIVPVRS